jgi:hypothetical protein
VFLLDWNDPATSWLIVTNMVLGGVIVVCVVVMLGGIAHEFISRAHRRHTIDAELDRDMRRLYDDHVFDSPDLGITMADGGKKRKP